MKLGMYDFLHGRSYKREISNRSTGQVLATTRIGKSNEKQKCSETKFADKMQLKNMENNKVLFGNHLCSSSSASANVVAVHT